MKQKTKREWLCSFFLLVMPLAVWSQVDSIAGNYLTRTTMYGLGHSNIYDTYLSPQEYTGVEFRTSRESMRMSRHFQGNVSIQSYFQALLSYTSNKSDNNNAITALFNWNYGYHYNFRPAHNLKLLVGGVSDFNAGLIYNLRNANNPASAKAYINLAASGMLIWDFRIKKQPITLRYQVNVPLGGVFFSPNYGQSYYEVFTLGNYSGVFKLTSLHNQPSMRHFLSFDIPFAYNKFRFSYICDIQQSKVNQLRTHIYGHAFMVGFVKEFYRIRKKKNR